MTNQLALVLPGLDKVVPDPIGNDSSYGLERDGGILHNTQSVGEMISILLPYVFAIAGLILFVMFIMAGFTLLTAVGNKEKMAKGTSMMTSAIIGFVIIFVAFWIMQILELVLGIKLGFGSTP